MSYDQAAMAAFAQQVIADCNGRMVTPTGESLNVDGRYGWQCMDLFIYIRYHLGFRDFLPTPDAASVWEMNWTAPTSTMWSVFDGITPDQPCHPGDIGIMNRQFFNNGVGHIFMIVEDLGSSIRVLELNGLGDGREDAAGNQYGSPARIHDWPKTCLYGYLRWIGPAPSVSAQSDTIVPIQEDDLMSALDEPIQYQGGRTGTTTLRNEIAWIATNFQTINELVKAVPGNTLNAQIPVAGEAKPRNTSLALETSWAASNFRGVAPAVANQTLKLADGTVASVASVLANIQAKPSAPAVAPTVAVDVNALATALAPLLAVNQVEQFVTEIRNLKFAAQ